MTAIYCRQSVDKKDSISIETQEQECRARLRSGETDVQVYCDRGYSKIHSYSDSIGVKTRS